jgi:hypothetical protein
MKNHCYMCVEIASYHIAYGLEFKHPIQALSSMRRIGLDGDNRCNDGSYWNLLLA